MASTTTEPDEMSISDAALATGLSVHTLRYYERAGLMVERVPRAASTHRRYRQEDIGWITFLTRLRSTGLPIARMKAYADLVREGPGNEAERLALLEAHRADVLAHMAQTQAHLDAINFKIDLYREGSNPR